MGQYRGVGDGAFRGCVLDLHAIEVTFRKIQFIALHLKSNEQARKAAEVPNCNPHGARSIQN